MIRFKALLFAVFITSSCNQISYKQIVPLIKEATIGAPVMPITQDIIDSKPYSFIKARFGKGAGVIMVLASIDQSNLFEWVSADGERLYTMNGKILRTTGLPYNINYLNNMSPAFYSKKTITTKVKLLDPMAYVTKKLIPIESRKELVTINHPEPISTTKHIVRSTFEELKWSKDDIYFVDTRTGFVIKSIQHLHPNLPKLEIEYYLKF